MERLSRRVFNLAAGSLVAAPHLAWPASRRVPKSIDHIIFGCNDLDAGIDYVFRRTGVRAAAGGVHPGAGTKNALLSLGTQRYLEILAPDPLQPAATDPRHVADLKHPALVEWAVHRRNLDEFASALQRSGVEYEGPKPGSRSRPDGTTLRWQSLTLKDNREGVLPFFIEWGSDSIHPSVDAPAGCRLTEFRIETPNPADLKPLAAILQLDVQIRRSDKPRLAATIIGPNGTLPLTSR
jgi:hypothetical protein